MKSKSKGNQMKSIENGMKIQGKFKENERKCKGISKENEKK